MANATVDSTTRFILKTDDAGPRDLTELDRDELETLRAAVETTLATMTAAERTRVGIGQDDGFYSEWWPPN